MPDTHVPERETITCADGRVFDRHEMEDSRSHAEREHYKATEHRKTQEEQLKQQTMHAIIAIQHDLHALLLLLRP